MAILQIEVVILPEDVAGHDRGVGDPVLLVVAPVHHVHHPLGEAVAVVGVVRRAVVDLGVGFSARETYEQLECS